MLLLLLFKSVQVSTFSILHMTVNVTAELSLAQSEMLYCGQWEH